MTLNCKVTAYSNDPYSINVPALFDGRTATNALARRGIAAADWAVFPPGTRLYIPGYGEALVENRGSGVRGYHVDVFMNSREEAIMWGVREMNIIVLKFGKRQSET